MTTQYQLLPPLSSEEFDALKADIKANGVREPVIVDENDVVLDGYHRLKCDKKAPRRVISGLTDGEKLAYVYRANNNRRNLSPAQKAEIRRQMRATAKLLREEGKTQTKIGKLLGVDRSTVAVWFISNVKDHNAYKPDARVKLDPHQQEEVYCRVQAGDTQQQVAADFKVTQPTISAAVRKHRKKADAKQRAEAAAAAIGDDLLGIHACDFRQQTVLADGQLDLIVTDPPYDKASVGLYVDLAKFAATTLKPGGWCLAYCGQMNLPTVLAGMSGPLEYGWTFCITHAGGDQRIRKVNVRNGWKPVVGFYRPPLNAWWDGFRDVVSGKREKDHHEWQQAEAEAAHFIEALSHAGGVVCDPMCGSGTTCVAAKRLGRRWVAFDIDGETAASARTRLHDMQTT